MARRTNPPTNIAWLICLVLYVVALLAHMHVFHLRTDFANWAWILGYGFLLVATRVRRL